FGTVPTYSTFSGYKLPDPSCASAVSAVALSPCRKSKLVPNKVTRVRGSAGLKLPAELSENGSPVMDTDSKTTARVEDDEMLKTDGGWFGAAATFADAAHINP